MALTNSVASTAAIVVHDRNLRMLPPLRLWTRRVRIGGSEATGVPPVFRGNTACS